MDQKNNFHDLFLHCGKMIFPRRLVRLESTGAVISVAFLSVEDIFAQPFLSFKFAFGWKLTEAVYQSIGCWGPYFQYNLFATVPPVIETGFTSPDIPLCVVVEIDEGALPQTLHIGVFQYDNNDTSAFPETKTGLKGLEAKVHVNSHIEECPHQYEGFRVTQGPYGISQRPRTPASVTPDPTTLSYWEHSPTIQAWLNKDTTPESESPEQPQPQIVDPFEQPMDRYKDVYDCLDGYHTPSSSNLTVGPRATDQWSSRDKVADTRAKRVGRAAVGVPEAVYIDGISSMTQDWSPDEIIYSRRIVGVNDSMAGSTRKIVLRPIAQDKWHPNMRCVSCIYWSGQQEYYITSVDVLLLLEVISGRRFAAADRIRTRRKVERFAPVTINRKENNPQTEEISRLILGLPGPKPMVVQKSTKIFKWSVLEAILDYVGRGTGGGIEQTSRSADNQSVILS
ncbi:hypothetical protein BDV24DRAFT_169303 [Aspergillus arachidicola]|uniref:DUF7082 domain-containing protein n=1 Tax=Aspergillus arachidicola TaxID=656916 RepID=A0A5N6XUU0_9EURO|nr:hypothetical protein BDV24DRAFT_169303 [Aspergillus arachidicola]